MSTADISSMDGEREPELPDDSHRELSVQQRALFTALSQRHDGLAQIYRGGCLALSGRSNPQYMFMAAYCFRELMSLMAVSLDLPVPSEPPGLKSKVENLVPHWTKRESALASGKDAQRETDAFLKLVGRFLDDFRAAIVTRAQRAAVTLGGIDPSRGFVPPVIQDLRIKEWATYSDYFNKILHHNHPHCTDAEFYGHIESFERFLLDYFRPRTFEDYSEIDAIIAEGEANA